jgi:8-oxo-dGTP pyrophosphatase MutT (NUDIX family)
MIRKAVVLHIISNEGKMLLLKRGKKSRYESGKWEQCGGAVKEGESYLEAGKRELMEELGVEGEFGEVIFRNQSSDMGDGVVWEIELIETRLKGKPTIQEPEKCEGLVWVKKEELKNVDLCTHSREDFEKLGWIN